MVSKCLNSGVGQIDDLERALHEALVLNEFVLHYQPYLDLVTQKIAGVEALIRWQHPAYGLIYPDHFIFCAERSSLITSIGEWVLQQACLQLSQWCALEIDIPCMSVNVSPRQFSEISLSKFVQTVLATNNLSPDRLDLEITESAMPTDQEKMSVNINQLRELGVKISIDDFGMGYSSLERLRIMQVDRLKIDRIFISGLALNPNDACLVRSMIHLAQQLGLSVIAEGIEDAEACVRLQAMGCHEGQGFYFTPALGASDCAQYLRDVQHAHKQRLYAPARHNRSQELVPSFSRSEERRPEAAASV